MITRDEEAYYDEEIAPVLLEIAHKCQARGIPFLALVQYGLNRNGEEATDTGETQVLVRETPELLAAWTARRNHSRPSLLAVAITTR